MTYDDLITAGTVKTLQGADLTVTPGEADDEAHFYLNGDTRVSNFDYPLPNGTLIWFIDNLSVLMPPSQVANTVAVVQAYYNAINAGDTEKALTYVADDAVFANPTGTYTRKDAIAESLKQIAQDKVSFDLWDFTDDAGRVVYAYKVYSNGSLVDSGKDGLTIVENGLIIFDGTLATEPK
jgi:ketosteroid isomerase-like protein